MISLRIALPLLGVLAFSSPQALAEGGGVDPQVKTRCFSRFKEMKGCVLIQLYRDKLPFLYSSYLDICRTRDKIPRLIADLQTRRKALADRSAVAIIDAKIVDLVKYDAALARSLMILEARAYELILTQYALQVVPEAIDDATRAKLRADVSAELKSTSTIMRQIEEADEDE